MKDYISNISKGARNIAYTGLTALALSSCGGGGSGSSGGGTGGGNPPVNNAPTCDISVSSSPESGYFPLETIVEGSCSDSDGDSLTVRLYKNGNEVATGNNQNYEETIVKDATYRIEATDPSGATGSASASVDGKFHKGFFSSAGDIYKGNLSVNEMGAYTGLNSVKSIVNNVGDDIEPASDISRLIFTHPSETKIPFYGLWESDFNGKNQREISSNISGPEGLRHADTCLDENSDKFGDIVFAYKTSMNVESGIGLSNSDMTSFLSLYNEVNSGRPAGRPGFNDDCSLITFNKFDVDNWNVYTINPNGTDLTQITTSAANDHSPSFLPDGRILYWSDQANPGESPVNSDLYAITTNSLEEEKLTNSSKTFFDPTSFKAPNGDTYLGFTAAQDFNPEILYITTLEGAINEANWIEIVSEEKSNKGHFEFGE